MSDSEQNSKQAEADEKARERLLTLLDKGFSTVQIGNMYGFNRGLIPYVLRGNHSPTVLAAFDLPIYEVKEVPVCPECGEIHTMHKMCGEEKRVQVRFRKSADLQSREQQHALDRIAYENGFDTFTEMCRVIADKKIQGYTVVIDTD